MTQIFKKIADCLKPGGGLKRSLAECEKRFDDVFNAATIGMAVVSLEGRLMRVNESVCSMLGYSREELLVRNIMELTHSDDLSMDRECMQNLLSGAKQHCHFEKRYIKKGGIVVSVIMSAAIIRDQDDKPQCFVVQLEDISQRDLAERELVWQLKVRDSIVELSHLLIAKDISVADISDLVLEHAKRLTGSEFGFVSYIDPKTGYMIAPTLTRDIWDKCQMEGKGVVFKEFKGLWGWVLNNKKPLLCNDLKNDKRSTGTPEGHVLISRFAGVPVMLGDVLLGQIAVANSPVDYVERDVDILDRLANIYGVAIQRKREEDSLLESTALLYTTLMSIGDAVVSTNAVGRITFMNGVAQAITGWTPEMALDHHVTEVINIINQRTGETVKSPVEKVLETGLPVRLENHTTLISRWGTMYSIDHNASPLKDADGNITGVVLVFRDVTKERSVANQLAESERKYRLLVENINEGIWVIDKDSLTTFVNPAMASMIGYTCEELIGKRLADVMDEDGRRAAERNIERRKNGISEVHDFTFTHKNGSKVYARVATSPMYDDNNEYIGAIAAISDVTERRKIEENLLMMSQTLEQSPSVVVITDTKGDIEYVNPKFTELTQYTLSEVKGKNPRILKSGELLPEQYEEMWKALDSGGDWVGEFHNRKKDGSLYWEHVRLFPIRNAAGSTTHYVKVAEDVTKTRLLDRLKDEFISTISHELRTPLSITKEGISLVLDEIPGKINEKQSKILSSARDSADRLARIINELLDISRLESGDMVLYRENISIKGLIERLAITFREKFQTKGLELNVKLPSTDLVLNIDGNKITQVFTNLVDNALKFTAHGSVNIIIEDLGDHVKCCVSDTGSGIAEEDIPSLFSKFRQFGRMPGAGDRGTGLGLAIAKGIVEMHKGVMTVESRAGEGSNFCFTLPKM